MLASPPVGPERDSIGRYELLLELGRGGMAVLHLARASGVGGFSRLFAIKQILPHLAADPPFVEMFLNEGRIAARLSHPNLCPVFELGQERGELFLVMEYLDGVPLDALAAAMPRDAGGLRLVAGVLAQACEGLQYAHTFRDVDGTAMPIIHRDVSPQNVFVSADGACRVLDFGVSKIATDRRRTRTGLVKGKLPYMAPEQLRGETLDPRADVWAVGVMLWEALTGARLFDRETDFLTYQAIIDAEIPSVNAGGARYPANADRVIAGALARDRDARYASARDLAGDLQRLCAELGGMATRAEIAEAVGGLCGAQLTARRAAIAAAIACRAPVVSPTSPTRPGEPSGPRGAASSPDAAATISMAMRRDAIVVARRRRRRWIAAALGVAIAATAATFVVALTRGASTPTLAGPPPATTPVVATPAPAPRAGDPIIPTVAPAPAPSEAKVASAPVGRPARRDAGRRTDAPSSIHDTGRTGSAPSSAHEPPAPASGPVPAKRDVQAAASGWYAIDSNPYATIFIDERKAGDTPLDRIPLSAGSHRVRAVLADGRQRSFSIEIAPDRKTSSGTLTW